MVGCCVLGKGPLSQGTGALCWLDALCWPAVSVARAPLSRWLGCSWVCIWNSCSLLIWCVSLNRCGKTTICQVFAALAKQKLYSVNCHLHMETSDFLGGLRPVRQKPNDKVCPEQMITCSFKELQSALCESQLWDFIPGGVYRFDTCLIFRFSLVYKGPPQASC